MELFIKILMVDTWNEVFTIMSTLEGFAMVIFMLIIATILSILVTIVDVYFFYRFSKSIFWG